MSNEWVCGAKNIALKLFACGILALCCALRKESSEVLFTGVTQPCILYALDLDLSLLEATAFLPLSLSLYFFFACLFVAPSLSPSLLTKLLFYDPCILRHLVLIAAEASCCVGTCGR